MSIAIWTRLRRHALTRVVVAVVLCSLAVGGFTQAATPTQTLAQQRTAFRAAWHAARHGKSWQPLAKGLQHYPLYPYLEAVALQHGIQTASPVKIHAYLQRYRGWIPAHRLRVAELHQAAQQKDWQTFRRFYQPGLGNTLTCDALQARLAQGKSLQFKRDLARLWQQTHLPSACTPVLKAAFVQGLLTPQRVWTRIEHAASAGWSSTIIQSAQWLTGADASAAMRMAKALSDPGTLLSNAAKFPNSPHDRAAVARALERLADSNNDQAQAFWQSLSPQFTFDEDQRNHILAALALYNAIDAGPDAVQRLAALPATAQTDTTRAWRVRAAVAQGDWKAAQVAIDALAPAQARHGEWRYWRARIAQKLGHSATALADYTALADRSTFYGFLAADRANLPYSICPRSIAPDATTDKHLQTVPGLRRAFEFFALGILPQARREWQRAFAGLTPDQQRQAAVMAMQHDWYSRAVFAMGKLGAMHAYALRFPLAYKPHVLGASTSAGINPAWAFAVIRAETGWQTDARSGANARGLMQLLPSTAAMVAHRHDLTYRGATSLSDPAINIPLGTQYLAHLASRFDGNPWLATAAYNAGPTNVRHWIEERGNLDPERFIFTIPFHATRAYVTRVLSFETIYDWRLHGAPVPVSSRMPAIGTPYDPKVDPPRKQVVCSVSTASTGTASGNARHRLEPSTSTTSHSP